MDLFKLVGIITADNKEAIKALDDTSKKGEETQGKLSKAFSTIGKGAAALGKAVVSGMAVAGAGVAALATKSIQSYADYEQLTGGIETLFKGSSGKVMEYANQAFQTAGMSANDYMETVTGFSASLLQSLGNDTNAAAEKANMALIDMSDNANKMGSDMESIKNAYAGFAKQNYTMLDNLKLGYGGTQEEMQRLLKDAQEFSGIEYDISSYADVVDAIHVVQTEMGITGTTAKEASTTISGSISSMKASWENLLTALASEKLDVSAYVDSFVNSVSTVGENLLPRIQIVLDGIVQMVDKLAPMLISKIPGILTSLLPAIISTTTSLINSIISILPALLDMLTGTILPQVLTGMTSIFEALISALPQGVTSIVSALPVLIPQLISGLVSLIVILCENLPLILQPIIDSLPLIITSTCNALLMNLPQLIMGVGQLILGLAMAIPQLCTALWESVKGIFSTLLSNMAVWFAPITQWFSSIWQGFIQIVSTCWETIKNAISVALKFIGSIISAAISIITLPFRFIWENCKEYVYDAFEWIKEKIDAAIEFIKNLVQTGFNFVKEKIINPIIAAKDKAVEIFNNIKNAISEKITAVKNKVSEIFNNIKSKISGTVDSIKSKVTNVFNAVKSAMEKPIQTARDTIKGIVDKIKGFFSGMKLEFPKIKTPHFGISPSGWKIADLLEGSIPKLSIEWYAKAMNNPRLMTSPTIFGYNPKTGNVMGGGEAGSEVVSGTNTLMSMIGAVVEGKMSIMTGQLVAVLTAILEAIVTGNEDTLQALLDGHIIQIGEREFGRLVREYA